MTAIIRVATAKAVPDKDYRSLSEALEPGDYPVDATVHLIGALSKGKSFETTVPNAANPWKLLAKALSKLNSATIESIVRDAAAVSDEEAAAVKAEAQAAIDRIVATTKRMASGRITGRVILEVL